MALIQMTLLSRSLMRTVPVTVVLPADKMSDFTDPLPPEKKFPTLYLLHGIIGSTMDWVSGTRLERYATDHDLCVVMPSGDNSFYLDRPGASQNYGQFVGQELVELTRRMFPLSRERKDTFIGGLSMGGYGALRNGLKYHDTFGAIVSLSASTDVTGLSDHTNDTDLFMQKRSYAEECFGDLGKVVESDKNPAWLVDKLAEEKVDFPEIYMACGDEDGLLPANRKFADQLTARNVPHTFEIGPGAHEWDFWDTYICKAMDWLPIPPCKPGISSGHVTKTGSTKFD